MRAITATPDITPPINGPGLNLLLKVVSPRSETRGGLTHPGRLAADVSAGSVLLDLVLSL